MLLDLGVGAAACVWVGMGLTVGCQPAGPGMLLPGCLAGFVLMVCAWGLGSALKLQQQSKQAAPANPPSKRALPCLQWAEEIERHVQPGQMAWGRYLPPGTAAVAGAAEEAAEGGDVAQRTRRSRRVAAAEGAVRCMLLFVLAGEAVPPSRSAQPPACSIAQRPCTFVSPSHLLSPTASPSLPPYQQVDLSRGAPVRPIMCQAADGALAPMHELDVVLM